MTDKYSNYTPDDDHKKKEQEQKDEIQNATEKTIEEKYSNYTPNDDHKINEIKQEEEILKSTASEYKTREKSTKKKLSILVIGLIFLGGVFGGSVFFGSSSNDISSNDSMTSNFLIQNLKGDTIDTWISWKKADGGLFHVHVLDSKYVTKERQDAIIDVIMSQQEIELDDSLMQKGPKGTSSTYYAGWYGALNSISDDTKFNIVKNLHFHVDDDVATGDIQIILTDLSNPDGYSGYTKSIVDEANHQILKSTITIYNIDEIGIENLKTILRHELGHGFGLAHSTAPEDMMYPVISTNYPYISDCDLDAISFLYDGGESSQVICEK